MADIAIWPGSSSFSSYLVTPGNPTPFGFYDTDFDFKTDADKVARFCAQRLGYPIQNVELQDINFWTAFEEAVTIYGNELYAYKIRENYLSLEGGDSTIELNESIITPNLGNVIRLSEQYGTEAGVGGNVNWYSGSVVLTGSVQDYDLGQWALDNGITDSDLEVKRVFYEPAPAIDRFYDPYGGTGTGNIGVIDSFGWGGYSPAMNFLMMPLNFDLARMQSIEMSETIRRSNYTFELINNQLRTFPKPGHGDTGSRLWFQYLLKSERLANSIGGGPGTISNVSNVPYLNPSYDEINSVGRSWIFEMTLAIAKEMLAYVRNKYTNIPIPGSDVTLNGTSLLAGGEKDKDALIEKLRTYFDETSRRALLERRANESQFRNEELGYVPMTIFIG
tara:strand:+ start:443 stop:1615 length:1173 start_codon:yes stop_codon:yes gene_type:complete